MGALLLKLILFRLVNAIQVDIGLEELRQLLLPEVLVVRVEINLNFPLGEALLLEVERLFEELCKRDKRW